MCSFEIAADAMQEEQRGMRLDPIAIKTGSAWRRARSRPTADSWIGTPFSLSHRPQGTKNQTAIELKVTRGDNPRLSFSNG